MREITKTRQVLEIVKQLMAGPATWGQIATSFDPALSRATVFRYLKELREADLVVFQNGAYFYNHQAPAVRVKKTGKNPFTKPRKLVDMNVLKRLEYAITHNHEVVMTYSSPRSPVAFKVTAVAIDLYMIANRLYLIAQDKTDKTVKEYRLDRMKTLDVMPDICTVAIKRMFFKVVFRVHGDMARSYEPAFFEYTTEVMDGGELEVTAYIHSLFRAKKILLSYGPAVTVLAPLALAEDLREEAKRIDANYA